MFLYLHIKNHDSKLPLRHYANISFFFKFKDIQLQESFTTTGMD